VTEEEVVKFFKKHKVVTWEQLTSQFGITRQSLQKKIERRTHLTSLNHNHRYLVLKECIGKVDQNGIWRHKGIVISIHGNTPRTLTHLIHASHSGLSAKQLNEITSVNCKTILPKLIKRGGVSRIKEGHDYIYLSSEPKVRQAQLENRGLTHIELLVEGYIPQQEEKPKEIQSFLELGEGDYLLQRLEIVRRVKSGKSKAQVARELGCTRNTVRKTYKTFEKSGAKGLVITREQRPHKMTESMERDILVMKAKYPAWSAEEIGKALRERGLDISDRSVRNLLEEVGLIHQINNSLQDVEISGAGMFLLKAMLQNIGFNDALKKISDPKLRFAPLDYAYTLAWMTVNDVSAPYMLNEMDLNDLAVLLNVPKSPLKDDIYDFYRNLTEDECEAFVDELARCYQRAGLIDGVVVFFDNHTIPYYGGVPIGFVYHATRNMPTPGIHLAQLNDFNGNFILFKLIPSTTEFADILIELLERMRRVLTITTPLILVVDREAERLPLFQELEGRNIHFIVVITKNSKVCKEMAEIPKSDFKEKFREKEKIMETEIMLKGIPFRAGVILHENGNRYGFRTNIPKEKIQDIREIAGFIPARWRQENKFEEIKNSEHGDKIAGYEFIDAPNIHLKKRYEKLQEQRPKIAIRIKRRESELEQLKERYEKKNRIFRERLQLKDDELKRLEERLRKAGDRNVFQGRLTKKIEARGACVEKYSTALSKLKEKMALVTQKLKKEHTKEKTVEEELNNIDLESEFFRMNTASTTFSIAVKEALANANSELTKRVSHDGRPMKVNRAKKVLYNLPGKITVDSSTKIVELAAIRNKALRTRIQSLCDWLNEKKMRLLPVLIID